jgi:GT2 family glycosyltransferase
MPEPLDVHLSIVNTDNRDRLGACLASLDAGCAGLHWQTTVVDNASRDGSAELVETAYPGIGVIRNERRLGISANHNAALRRVVDAETARYVLAMHEDIELTPGSVTRLVEHCDAHRRTGAAGPQLVDGSNLPIESTRRFPNPRRTVLRTFYPRLPRPEQTGALWLDAPCTLFRVAALRQVGLFDERFFGYFEEVDLAVRLLRAGWTSELCADATVVHHAHGTWGRNDLRVEAELRTLRSGYLYYRKHWGAPRALAVSSLVRVALLTRAGKAAAAGALTSDPGERRNGRYLLSLARFNPRKPLPLEGRRR